MLDFGRSESPNQNGIPHQLGILLVAKANTSVMYSLYTKEPRTPSSSINISLETPLVPTHHKYSRTTVLLNSCLEMQCQEV